MKSRFSILGGVTPSLGLHALCVYLSHYCFQAVNVLLPSNLKKCLSVGVISVTVILVLKFISISLNLFKRQNSFQDTY